MAATCSMSSRRFERPSSAKLAGVKFGLYHPALPTLRRMSMDDITHKLPPEHSRTTTPCGRDEFVMAKTTLRKRGWNDPDIPCKNVLTKTNHDMLNSSQPLKTRSYTENWTIILKSLAQHNANTNTGNKREAGTQTDSLQLTVTGLASRSLHPDITGSWQNHRRPTSGQWGGQANTKQMPAAMYSRYRASRPYYSSPWK